MLIGDNEVVALESVLARVAQDDLAHSKEARQRSDAIRRLLRVRELISRLAEQDSSRIARASLFTRLVEEEDRYLEELRGTDEGVPPWLSGEGQPIDPEDEQDPPWEAIEASAFRAALPDVFDVEADEMKLFLMFSSAGMPGLVREFLLPRPHLVLPLGFDEYRVVDLWRFDDPWRWVDETFGLKMSPYGMPPHGALFRQESSGAWFRLETVNVDEDLLVFHAPRDYRASVPLSEWLSSLRDAVQRPDPKPPSLWFAGRWTPDLQRMERTVLAETIRPLLQAIHRETRSLRDLASGEMEDLVAELLWDLGADVKVTPRRGDGGRDVIVRGAFVTGDPQLMAVEVKQKKTIDIEDVRAALWANRNYPALLIATSGTLVRGSWRKRSMRTTASGYTSGMESRCRSGSTLMQQGRVGPDGRDDDPSEGACARCVQVTRGHSAPRCRAHARHPHPEDDDTEHSHHPESHPKELLGIE